MKKLSLILFLMIAAVGITTAQQTQAHSRTPTRTPEERAELKTNRMVKDLSLTNEQATKLKETNLVQAKKMETIRIKQAEDRKEFRQEAQAVVSSTEEKYKEILTPEQFEKYQKEKIQRIESRKGKMSQRRFKN